MLAEQVELGAAVHGSLKQLQLVDLPFSLTVAPRQGECRADSSAVMLETCCEGDDGTDAAIARVGEPGIEGVNTRELPLADDPCIADEVDEPADEPNKCRRLGILPAARASLPATRTLLAPIQLAWLPESNAQEKDKPHWCRAANP